MNTGGQGRPASHQPSGRGSQITDKRILSAHDVKRELYEGQKRLSLEDHSYGQQRQQIYQYQEQIKTQKQRISYLEGKVRALQRQNAELAACQATVDIGWLAEQNNELKRSCEDRDVEIEYLRRFIRYSTRGKLGYQQLRRSLQDGESPCALYKGTQTETVQCSPKCVYTELDDCDDRPVYNEGLFMRKATW